MTDNGAGGDFQLEEQVGRILRVGVRASSVCLGVGLILSFLAWSATAGEALMIGGLVALMATPIARVATSVVDYARRRDWLFFAFTLIVLIELTAGIIAALAFHRRV